MTSGFRLGVYGGRFDPVHRAHWKLARAAIDQLQLDRLLIVPAARPAHRAAQASAEHRLTMLHLALDQWPIARLEIDPRELRREGPTYTIDTIRELARDYPHVKPILVIGADQMASFDRWRQWQDILEACQLAVAAREGFSSEWPSPVCTKLAELGSIANATQPLRIAFEPDAASATEIRRMLARRNLQDQTQLKEWLAESVLDYIVANKLYQIAEAQA